MRKRAGNIANALCLLLCAITLVLWKTQPHWFAMGWARDREIEVHMADGYIEVVTAHHMTNDALQTRQPGEFFVFHQSNSAWGNPILRQWAGGWSRIWPEMWFGHGTDAPDSTGAIPSSRWLAIDTTAFCAAAMVWPMFWVLLRMLRRMRERDAAAAK